VALHDSQELGDDLGAGSDEDLALAGLLGVVDRVKSVVENGSLDHLGGCVWRFSNRWMVEMRYLPKRDCWLAFKSREHGECPRRGFCPLSTGEEKRIKDDSRHQRRQTGSDIAPRQGHGRSATCTHSPSGERKTVSDFSPLAS
jgi:hypothetical protein